MCLDDFGWTMGRVKRQQVLSHRDLYHENSSTKLHYLAEGREAVVYTHPDEPGFVIKFYPKNRDPLHGFGVGHEYAITSDGIIGLKARISDDPVDLVMKIMLLNALGLLTEFIGLTDECDLVVRQKAIFPEETASGLLVESGELATTLRLYQLPTSIFNDLQVPPGESAIIFYDHEFWLLTDLHKLNIVEDEQSRTWIADANASQIPAWIIRQSSAISRFLDAIKAHEAGRTT